MEKQSIIQEHTRLTLEYSNLPLSANSLEEYEPIARRKEEILKRIEELKQIEQEWEQPQQSTTGLARMRTITQCAKYLKEQDPESGIGEYYIRRMIHEGKIPVVKSGRKQLVNLDKLMAFFNEGEAAEPEKVEHGKIRKVY